MNRKTVSGTMLTLLLASMLSMTFNVIPVEAEEWNVERITYGFLPSLIIDGHGRSHISYYDGNYLGYATKINDMWQIEDADNRAGHIGQYSSIALDENRNPHVSYIDSHYYYPEQTSVMYASRDESDWTIEYVDRVGFLTRPTSLAINTTGTPIIAYYDGINRDLKYAFKSGASWIKETIDSAGDVGEGASLALDSHDLPRISYYDRSNRKLKYAKWNGSSWNIEVVDSSAAAGWGSYISMSLDSSDAPHTAYRSSAGVLKYVKWNGSLWIIETVVGDAVNELSLAVDSNGNPHIAYTTWGDLRYAVKDGHAWKTMSVSKYMGDAGLSLALDPSNGKISIAYEGSINNGDLNYAGAPYEPISPPIERTYGQITIISPQNITYHLNSIDLDYFTSITTSWVGYSLDGEANKTLAGSVILAGLKNGHHSITLYVMDAFGDMYVASVMFTVYANPAVLFTIPDDVRITFSVGYYMMPKTEFQVGEWVELSLWGEWLSAGTHHAFASNATFVVSNETGYEVWNRAIDHPIGEGWTSGPGGGWGIGVGWGQVDNLGNPVPPGTYKAGIIFTANSGFDFPEDHSDILSLLVIDPTPPNASAEVWVNASFTPENATHFQTIQKAIDNAAWGGIVHVAPGIYNENILIGKDLVLISDSGPSLTTIRGVEKEYMTTTVTFRRVTGSTVIDGFTIIASSDSQSRGIQLDMFAHPIISHNVIISKSARSNAYGIDTSGFSNPTIDHNTIIVSDNVRFTSGIPSYGGNPIISNNIIVGDRSSESAAIAVGNRAVPSVHKYNYFYNWQYAIKEWGVADYPLGEGEVFTNIVPPRFVDSERDYHLRDDSPCVGAGENGTNMGAFPWSPWTPPPRTISELKSEIEEMGSEGDIDNQGIVRSLLAKLNVAQKLVEDGKIDQAKNILNAFINEVQAQSGKHITPEAAGILIESAEYILSHL